MIEPKMVFVEEGTFNMGAGDGEGNEKPIHSVTLSNFFIGKYIVTQLEWVTIIGLNPSHYLGDNLPVNNVSWNDIQKFLARLNSQTGKQYRLPTEAEWEFAARGGNLSKGFEYAGSNDLDEVAWHFNNCKNLQPVGQKKPNELGIYDMSGNVKEWCDDWYGSYLPSDQANPKGPDIGSGRVIRGGSWNCYSSNCRTTNRYSANLGWHLNTLGFRLAHDFDTFN